MNRFIFTSICSASVLLASTGVALSQPAPAAQQSGGASNSHSQDDHQRTEHTDAGGASQSSQSESNAHGKRSNGRSTSNDSRDERIEGASSGSTATSSTEAGPNSDRSQDGSAASGEGAGVVHPNEP